ncbi:chemotaxis protein CheW [Paenibacillus xylaniclasticus]|uniref:chemotaxis protein CheW n=1 Tax=Paenibacillus xylaniclasticus TaxID=588083 RepID=UPI000FD7911D|nr:MULTISPECIES: chemotaxis protein CheW [Paenibacillus]GFN30456.1 chemotaxis protein CheW [Paenibacillus curdlanolyticus]
MSEAISENVDLMDEDSQKDKYLTFIVDEECYGIEIRYVTEIIGLQKITSVPEMPDFVRGIVNLRGKIIPVMDVRVRFNKPYREYMDRTCIIVIDINELSIGLIVDSVSEVMAIPSGEVVAPPDLYKRGHRFVMGIGKVGNEVKLLLDCDKLLNDHEVEQLLNH